MPKNTTRKNVALTTTPIVVFGASDKRVAIFVPAHGSEILWVDFGRDPANNDGIPIHGVTGLTQYGVWFRKEDWGEYITQDFRVKSATNPVSSSFYDVQEF